MKGIIFHYENSVYTVEMNIWDQILAIWSFDHLIMVDPEGNYLKRTNRFSTLEEAMTAFDGYSFIALDPAGETSLQDFVHPDGDVIYIIGSNTWKTSQIPEGVQKVKINTPVDSQSRPLDAMSAAVCLAYDILVKG